MDDSIYWLDRIAPSERLLVGEKAFILSQLHQKGFPVLPGFVISSMAFHQFLEQLNDSASLLADFPASSLYLNVDNPQALQLVARQSRQTILRQNLSAQWLSSLKRAADGLNSPTLILRASIAIPLEISSGATGLLPSQVCCNTSEELELALKKLWSQLFSSKSLFYWQRMGVGLEKVHLAVLVQPITNAIAAGVAYLEADYYRVQASWGLGHSLLQGEVLPDFYQIIASTARVQSQQLGNKTRGYRLSTQPSSALSANSCLEAYQLSQEEQTNYCLNENLIVKLNQILQQINPKIYQVIEWTLTQLPQDFEPQFYINQADLNGSETLLNNLANSELIMTDSAPILTGLPASTGIIYALTYVLTDLESSWKNIPEKKF